MSTTGPTLSSPKWCAEALSPERLMPGGAKVLASAFSADSSGKKFIEAGTVLGRTLTERDAGTALGPADAADDEVFILAFDVQDASDINDCELLKPFHGTVVRESFLPGFSGLASAVQTLVRARYNCIRGAA